MFRPEPAQAQLQLQVAGAIPVDGRRGRIPGAEAAPSPPESGPPPTYNDDISPEHMMYRRYGLRAPFGHWPMHDEGPAVSITKCACCEAGGNHRAVSDAVPFELPPPPSPPPTQRQGRPAKSVARSNSEASSTSSRSRSSSSLNSLSPLSERRKRASSCRSTRSSESSSSSSVSTSSSWSTISASSALSSPQQEHRRASCSAIPSPNTAPLLKQRWASCGAIPLNASSSTALVRSGREDVTLCISQPSGEQTNNDVIASVVSSTSEEQTTVNYSASPTSGEETVADTSVPSTSGKETVADVSFPPTSGEDTVADCISVLPTAGQPTKATVHLSPSAGQPTKAVSVPPKTVKKSAAIFSIKRVMFSPSLYSGKRSNGSVCVAQSFGNPTQASVSNSATSEKPTGASVSASVPARRHTQATFSAEQLPQDSSSAQSLAPSSPPSAPLSKSVQPQLQPTASASAVPSLQLPSSSQPSAAPQQPPPADNTSSEDSFGAANDAQNSREPFVASYEDDQGGTYVGSFPKGFGYGPDEAEIEGAASPGEEKPRILLMGLRRSGKSSIQKVVFHKVSPNETLFLESTNKIVKDDISNSSFVQFQIWDIPGQIDFFDSTFDSEYIFGGCGALIFVIDAQDDYMEALSRLQMAVTRAHKINENIKFEVFIHKVDGLSDDNKIETQRDILQRATDELADAGMDNIRLSFHLTSIYDHSIFEAFSKVVQKLIPQLPVLENLLDIVISNSKIEKAFLFDVVSKIYIATDSSPVDMQCYELCCDMIDVVIDMSCIYGVRDDGAFDNESASFIKLNSSTVLFLREVNRHLALLCILREDGCENRGIIEYNFKCFRNAIQEVFVARNKEAGERAGHKLVRAEDGAVAKPHGGQSNGLLGAAGSSHSHLNGSVVKEGEDN